MKACISRWNDQVGGDGDDSVYNSQGASSGGVGRTMMKSWMSLGWTAYISVGSAADYPDRCLVTAATPDGSQSVEQFTEQSDGLFQLSSSGVEHHIDDVPESARNWNAHLLSNGDLAPGSVTDSDEADQSESDGEPDYPLDSRE